MDSVEIVMLISNFVAILVAGGTLWWRLRRDQREMYEKFETEVTNKTRNIEKSTAEKFKDVETRLNNIESEGFHKVIDRLSGVEGALKMTTNLLSIIYESLLPKK